MVGGTSTTAILVRAHKSASAVSSWRSMHFKVGTAMPNKPGEVKSSALRTVFFSEDVGELLLLLA
eukprot:11306557-Prorocentrum_lima.AAC.1